MVTRLNRNGLLITGGKKLTDRISFRPLFMWKMSVLLEALNFMSKPLPRIPGKLFRIRVRVLGVNPVV